MNEIKREEDDGDKGDKGDRDRIGDSGDLVYK